MNEDISELLSNWKYDPDELSVRWIRGRDRRPKVQLRVDLGLLQMEADGRPDGEQPGGFESLLEYQLDRLEAQRRQAGSSEGFLLDQQACRELMRESTQYYHRYLSLFQLGDFERVARDTERNLRVFDLLHRYAEEEEDRLALEQYRPYVLMMNAKARAAMRLQENDFAGSLSIVQQGMEAIEQVLRDQGLDALIPESRELMILQELAEQLQESRPVNQRERLEQELQQAIEQEDYERAAELRDVLRHAPREDEAGSARD